MGKKLSELVEATALVLTDIFHLRTPGGIDKKVTLDTILEDVFDGDLNTHFKGQGVGIKSIFEKLTLNDTGIKIGSSTRNAAGAQLIEGIGFQSSVVLFFAVDTQTGQIHLSWGFDDGTIHASIRLGWDGSQVALGTTYSLDIYKSGTNYIRGYISTMSADGFTITWAKDDIRAVNFMYLCLP